MTLSLLAVQAVVVQSDFERVVDVVADVAIIIVALAVIAVALATAYGAMKARAMMKRVRTDLDPALRNVTAVTENAEYLSRAVREDVDRLRGTVNDANERFRAAMTVAERRLGELDALAGVMQAEAESLFIRGAATVRGVQVGAAALRGLRRGRRDDDDAYAGELDEVLDDEGMDEPDDIEVRRVHPPRRTILDD